MKYVKTYHTIHILLSICTGFWIIVWLWRTAVNNEANKQMSFKMQQETLKCLDRLIELQEDK